LLNAELYNGTSWTEVGDVNTARYQVCRIRNIYSWHYALVVIFQQSANTESWNGSAWTEVNDLNYSKNRYSRKLEHQTSALAFGGYQVQVLHAITETWDGTSWTEGNDLNTARRFPGGAGTNAEAVLAFGGNSTPPIYKLCANRII
jgi:hypothetical protein